VSVRASLVQSLSTRDGRHSALRGLSKRKEKISKDNLYTTYVYAVGTGANRRRHTQLSKQLNLKGEDSELQ
jgi:hypothetical protein